MKNSIKEPEKFTYEWFAWHGRKGGTISGINKRKKKNKRGDKFSTGSPKTSKA